MIRQYMDEHLPRRVALALIVAVVFMVAGKAIPDAYFKYFDNKQYFTVIQPIPVDKKMYKPCEDVMVTATRTSLLNTDLDATVELVLRKDNNVLFKVPEASFTKTAVIESAQNATVLMAYPLPCDLEDGIYYWQIFIKYDIYGNKKTYLAVTDTFHVSVDGTHPDPLPTETLRSIQQSRVTPQVTPRTTPQVTPQPTETSQESEAHTTQSVTIIDGNSDLQQNPTPQQNQAPIKGLLDKIKNLL